MYRYDERYGYGDDNLEEQPIVSKSMLKWFAAAGVSESQLLANSRVMSILEILGEELEPNDLAGLDREVGRNTVVSPGKGWKRVDTISPHLPHSPSLVRYHLIPSHLSHPPSLLQILYCTCEQGRELTERLVSALPPAKRKGVRSALAALAALELPAELQHTQVSRRQVQNGDELSSVQTENISKF